VTTLANCSTRSISQDPAVSRPAAVRALLVADTVVDPIGRFLADPVNAPAIQAQIAPYNQVRQILLDTEHPAWRQSQDFSESPNLLIIWTTPAAAVPAFAGLLEFRGADVESILAEVDELADAILSSASRAPWVFVVSWTLPPYRRWVQARSMRHETGAANVLMRMNLRLAERLAPAKNIVLLDSQYWHASLQRPSHDPKLQAMAQVSYSRDLFVKAAAEIKAVYRGLRGQGRKLVICDLDNTLWGGILGDDGIDGLQLGGHDGIGQSFAGMQCELLSLRRRGVLLAVCSKNDHQAAIDAIERHPEMLLRLADFVSLRINREDKAANVEAILRELNLLPQSAVFLDDHPAERDRVRRAFPEMLVPDLPQDIAAYPSFVASLDCFEAGEQTTEDQARTELYRIESKRRAARAAAGDSVQAWLESLNIRVTILPLDRINLPRAAQLLNKTNQFNMSVRRMSDDELWRWSSQPGRTALLFSVADRFGDSGITGLITSELRGDGSAALVDFVMSCRVMGKQIEDAILARMCRRLTEAGATSISASCVQTDKNEPVRAFLAGKYASPPLLDLSRVGAPGHIAIESREN